MAAKMYYDQDADFSLLKGKTIAIIGYGSQGHAQAQNLRDSGCNVVVGQRRARPITMRPIRDGFKPVSAGEAAEAGNLVNILLPDEVQGEIYAREIKPHLRPGDCAPVLARIQHPFRAGCAAGGSRLCAGCSQGAGPSGSQRVRQRGRRALPDRDHGELHAGRQGACACLCQGDRRHAGGRVADDVCRGDRDRPFRRAGRALRRRECRSSRWRSRL